MSTSSWRSSQSFTAAMPSTSLMLACDGVGDDDSSSWIHFICQNLCVTNLHLYFFIRPSFPIFRLKIVLMPSTIFPLGRELSLIPGARGARPFRFCARAANLAAPVMPVLRGEWSAPVVNG